MIFEILNGRVGVSHSISLSLLSSSLSSPLSPLSSSLSSSQFAVLSLAIICASTRSISVSQISGARGWGISVRIRRGLHLISKEILYPRAKSAIANTKLNLSALRIPCHRFNVILVRNVDESCELFSTCATF